MLDVDIEKSYGDFTLRAKFSAPTPGVIAVFGRSGCGKTTLINVLAGLTAADRGFVRLDGVSFYDSAQGAHVAAEHRAIGYVFQDSRLFPHLDVRGNLMYGAQRARGRPRSLDFEEVLAAATSFPAANASASPWAAPCLRSRAYCCSTSRSPR
jgi:molybdate transport system ATP-binding protein